MKKFFWGYLEGTISVIINTILFGLKYWVGIMTNSIAILADAWHTLSDTLTSLVVILGFMISSRKPDKKHPFGHGRAELISSVIIATLLAVVGFSFLIESIQRFRNHEPAAYNLIAVIIFVISVISKEALAQFSIILGKKNKLRSLIADGWHHRSDSIASGLILIGMVVGKYMWWIDSVMGAVVSILIFYAASDILKGSMSLLIGEEPDDDFRSILKKIIIENGLNNESVHHIHIHRYGEHLELTFHLRLPPEMSLSEAHSIANKLENKIREKINIETTIHVEPSALPKR